MFRNVIFIIIENICFMLSLSVVYISCDDYGSYYTGTRMLPNDTFVQFRDLQSILDVFESERAFQPEKVDTVLQAYEACHFAPDREVPETNRRPFIVVEGNIRRNKELIAKVFAQNIGAKFLLIPPKCLSHLTLVFERGTLIRNAFFALSLYVSAYNARQLLAIDTPVVMNGFWTEQAAFMLNKKFARSQDLPIPGSSVYEYPVDLMRPDMLFYLESPFLMRSRTFTTSMPNWKSKAIYIYQRFNDPRTTVINSGPGPHKTSEEMYYHMNNILGQDFDLSLAVPRTIGNI